MRRLESAFTGFAALSFCTCSRSLRAGPDAAPVASQTVAHADSPDAAPAVAPAVAQLMFDSGLAGGWQDWGWSPREIAMGGPARVRFDNWGGWTLAKPGLQGTYGGVVFRVKTTPGEAEFLEVRVESSSGTFPRVKITPGHHKDLGEGWSEVFVPIAQLDPDGAPFERFTFRTFRLTSSDWVYLDHIGLTKVSAEPPRASAYDLAKLRKVALSVDCKATALPISPTIYGINYYGQNDPQRQAAQWLLGATARRWGGNTMSTYNWELNTWNTGQDWFYENVSMPPYTDFVRDDVAHDIPSAITVPMIGWVAKDGSSFSFPVSAFGPQESTDTRGRADAGNGRSRSGALVRPGPPSRAYVPSSPAFVKKWVEAIRQEDAKTGKRSVQMYILDNEPALWSLIHRDVHPDPVSYDELVERTVAYGTAIRQADPDAIIAGPAEWGWAGFLYSAKDLAAGPTVLRPDRRAHGDVPLMAYYLKALREREAKTGVRILDVLDLHGYPQAKNVYGDAVDPSTAALRLRQTRMLWDDAYVDESWIHEPVKLLPRMRQWIDENYPGRAMSIGEWNFGGEGHMSGALAIAEALGRFAEFGVTWAFYWTYPPENSPAMWAFRAYRDYDGKGGHFLDWSQPTKGTSPDVSLFASRDESGTHMVLVALNLSPQSAVAAQVDVGSCGTVTSQNVYSYVGGAAGIETTGRSSESNASVTQALPPYSITVMDLRLADALSVAK